MDRNIQLLVKNIYLLKIIININNIQFLVEHGIYINKDGFFGDISLFNVCKNENDAITIVRYK